MGTLLFCDLTCGSKGAHLSFKGHQGPLKSLMYHLLCDYTYVAMVDSALAHTL